MATGKEKEGFEKPKIDEAYLMKLMSGDEIMPDKEEEKNVSIKQHKTEKNRGRSLKMDYKETFLVNRFPSGRTGKVVYIRTEFHERLLRLVQLTSENRVTLYSYIDNILDHHFKEFGDDITEYFNDHFKPIL